MPVVLHDVVACLRVPTLPLVTLQTLNCSGTCRFACRYFALIIRAISVLEGIALVGNDEFAIIDEVCNMFSCSVHCPFVKCACSCAQCVNLQAQSHECFTELQTTGVESVQAYPYIAQRLLTDDSPRLRESLKYMIYGRDNVFDAERLIDMLNAFETFTVNSRSAAGDTASQLAPALPGIVPVSNPSSPNPAPIAFPAPAFSFGNLSASAAQQDGGFAGVMNTVLAQQAEALSSLLGLPERIMSGNVASTSGAGASVADSVPRWQTVGSDPKAAGGSRAALLFLLSDEGQFFRTFLLDEIVRSIDAMSRSQLAELVKRLNLGGVMLPVFLPGAKRMSIALSPDVDEQDRRQVESVAKLVEFLAGGSVQRLLSGNGAELLPLMPRVAQQILPEVTTRLVSRISARFVRTFYLSDGEARV